MSTNKTISVRRRNNLKTFLDFKNQNWDYIINPKTGELHSLKMSNYLGCHNLKNANLERFESVVDIGQVPIANIENGEEIDIVDIESGKLITTYKLDKCSYCFR